MKKYQLTNAELIALAKKHIEEQEEKIKITESRVAYQLILKQIKNWNQEHFIVIYMNHSNKPNDTKLIHLGTLNKSLVHPREVFAPAIELRSSGIILAHNHPSGALDISNEDAEVTNRLLQAGKILGISILDHIIFSASDHISMRKNSLSCIFD